MQHHPLPVPGSSVQPSAAGGGMVGQAYQNWPVGHSESKNESRMQPFALPELVELDVELELPAPPP